jgi:hypothetical protein
MRWTNDVPARTRGLARALWRDDSGLVLSAETVLLGTLGVIGATVGLSMASSAVNDELTETAFAIRALDQSYAVNGRMGTGAYVAGSRFTQRPVAESHAALQQTECALRAEAMQRQQAAAERFERMWQEQDEREQKRVADARRQRIEEERRRVQRERTQRERRERDNRPDNQD